MFSQHSITRENLIQSFYVVYFYRKVALDADKIEERESVFHLV